MACADPLNLPSKDADLPAFWRALGVPGAVDVHVHFMPEALQQRVWAYFDRGGPLLPRPVAVTYRDGEAERVQQLRNMGCVAWTCLFYAHKPGMAEALNDWGAQFAEDVPGTLRGATFYPEPSAARYVADAIRGGVRAFKAHVAVGRYDPRDALLDPVWGAIEDAGTPVIVHASSSPAGAFTGPGPIGEVLARHPRLRLIFAHLGMPEYREFVALAQEFHDCGLDVSMVFDDMTTMAPLTRRWLLTTLPELADRLLWGSDYPSIPHPVVHQVRNLARLGFDREWLSRLFWDNGATLFRLVATRA